MLKTKAEPSFDTDVLMKGVFHWLIQDLRSSLSPDFYMKEETLFNKSLVEYRNKPVIGSFLSPYYYFKAKYQMDSLFKRYRFTQDVYTDQELEELTNKKFLETQSRIAVLKPSTYRSTIVLKKARSIITEILGKYDLDEHRQLCKFGKRASVGCPAAKSYLDFRLSQPLTGSREHISWFKNHLKTDKLLSEVIQECSGKEPEYQICNELTLTNVPKSYKSLRTIMPNTTIGGFYTYGLGKVIQNRLSSVGLHIPNLQNKHRLYVKEYSRTRTHVTADLSAASDSFTCGLLNKLLPRPWFNVLNFGRIKHFKMDGRKYHLESFMTMGIGFTFQLQTLCFYGILKAIEVLSKVSGRISVYGDDLIYPQRMHNYVTKIFSDIGFILNSDKTFNLEEFRESCGSDCYCGYDVRPFQPEGAGRLLSSRPYTMLVYKTINGLLRRWSEYEIGKTLQFLYNEILRIDNAVLQVPPSYPDYSGVKVLELKTRSDGEFWAPIHYNMNGSFQFSFYKETRKNRMVLHQVAYYWDSLRSSSSDIREIVHAVTSLRDVIAEYETLSEFRTLRWIKHPTRKFVRSKLTGRRLRRLCAVVAVKKGRETFISQTSSIPAWT